MEYRGVRRIAAIADRTTGSPGRSTRITRRGDIQMTAYVPIPDSKFVLKFDESVDEVSSVIETSMKAHAPHRFAGVTGVLVVDFSRRASWDVLADSPEIAGGDEVVAAALSAI
jgi:ribosomal protein L21E